MTGDATSRAGLADGDSGPRGPTWRGDLLFSASVAVLVTLLVLRVFPELLSGRLLDTDSYMRLVRVRRLAEGGWFDGTIPRSNAPFGETLHWTRPVDVLLLLGAWLAAPFLGFQRALHLSGVLLSPVLLVAVCLTTAWAARPLAGARIRYYTMLTVLAQVGIMGYALPGRADHNMLMLLAFIAMLGWAFRATEAGRGGSWRAWLAGAWAGLGLWVSTEFLAPLFVLLASWVIVWIWRGVSATQARSGSAGLVLVTFVAVTLEHPPASLLVAEYDRVSVVHLLLAVLIWAFFGVATSRPARALGVRGRTILGLGGGVVATAVMLFAYPDFFGGPMVDVHPELKRSWLPFLTEFQPYLMPEGLAGLGRILAYLGHALLAAGVVVHGLWRNGGHRLTGAWILLGVALAVFIPLGIRWVRFVTYAEILGVVGTACLLARTLHWSGVRFSGIRLGLVRGAAAAALIAGPLLVGAAVMAVGGETGGAVRQATATQTGICPVEDLVAALNDPEGLGARPRTVLAHLDLGPTLLYRTSHSVVATPYHRNWRGILDWQNLMATRDPDEARRMILSRGIDVVVACGADVSDGSPSIRDPLPFIIRLETGQVYEWLVRRPTPDARGLAIYEVQQERER